MNKDHEIPDSVKAAILDFTDDLEISGISKHRQYFYIERLKIIARIMKEKFLSPDRKAVRSAILELQKLTTKRKGKFSERSINDIKMSLKKFYKIHENGKYLDEVKWLELNKHPSKEKKPDDIVTIQELSNLLNASMNDRDKAIISMLYDSGCRIGEILTLRIKDVEFDNYGMRLQVHGKTGNRIVRVVGDSVSFTRTYIDNFGKNKKKSQDDVLFTKIGSDEPVLYADINTMLYKVSRRAGLNRRIHPHLFRHTRATLLAKDLKEAPLEATMGWVHGSKMSRVYVHLSDQDIDNAVLKVYGIEPEEQPKGIDYRPKVCFRCKTENPTVASYCVKCGLPLSYEELENIEIEQKEAIDALMGSPIDTIFKEFLKTPNLITQMENLTKVLRIVNNDPELIRKMAINEEGKD